MIKKTGPSQGTSDPESAVNGTWVALAMAVILALAAVVRLAGIAREPFWLDEIFSFDFTSGTLAHALAATAHDVHPPVYYVGLLVWRWAFGSHEAILRSYSVLWSLAGIAVIALLALEVARSKRTGIIAALLLALNPLDIYFAQDARMYAQAAALAALSTLLMLLYLRRPAHMGRKTRRWVLFGYVVTAGLLALTHYIGITVLLSQGLFAIGLLSVRRRWRDLGNCLLGTLTVAVLCLPWLWFVTRLRSGLYNTPMLVWIPQPSLGAVWDLFARDLFWGRPGLSARLWWPAELASMTVIIFAAALMILHAKSREARAGLPRRDSDIGDAFLVWMSVGPLAVALLISWLYHPIFYHPRFSLFLVAPVIALISIAATRSPKRVAGMTLIAATLVVELLGAGLQYGAVTNVGMRGFAKVWKMRTPPNAIYFYPRWNRRVAEYYLHTRMPVLARSTLIDRLHGDVPAVIWICTKTGYQPDSASGAHAEREWLLSLGPHHAIATVDHMTVVKVDAPPTPRVYPTLEVGLPINLGSHSADRYLWKGWYAPERTFRWSRGTRALVLFSLKKGDRNPTEILVSMSCYSSQRVRVALNGKTLTAFTCHSRALHKVAWDIPSGALKRHNTLVLDLPDAVSPAQLHRGHDRRQLAVGIATIRLE